MLILSPSPDNDLTPYTLSRAISSVRTIWGSGLLSYFDIPLWVQSKIRFSPSYPSEDEKIKAALQYALQTLPGMSWTRIAGVLWFMEEYKALETVRQYLPHKPGNYTDVCNHVFVYQRVGRLSM